MRPLACTGRAGRQTVTEDYTLFSDPRLELCGYSREEIWEGLRDCAAKFGVDKALLDAFQP